jgi:hypothetical protein
MRRNADLDALLAPAAAVDPGWAAWLERLLRDGERADSTGRPAREKGRPQVARPAAAREGTSCL